MLTKLDTLHDELKSHYNLFKNTDPKIYKTTIIHQINNSTLTIAINLENKKFPYNKITCETTAKKASIMINSIINRDTENFEDLFNAAADTIKIVSSFFKNLPLQGSFDEVVINGKRLESL